jgi:4-alpha-glucanotransferase
MSTRRQCGVLLPVPALPAPYGIGDFGPEARAFGELLASSGQALWQVLPLTPTTAGAGNSPYSGLSAFALDAVLVSPQRLADAGLLAADELPLAPPSGRIRYGAARRLKGRLLESARRRFGRDPARRQELARFRERHAGWLEDFALYCALRQRLGGRSWLDWPVELREREPAALRQARQRLATALERHVFVQLVATQQWEELRSELAGLGIEVMGDLPFYVALDSADVWAHRGLFALDEGGRPRAVSGCPPDAFTAAGQLWGQPVYRWEAHRDEGFAWWSARVDRQLALFDRVRLDHFRGLAGTWQVPAGAATAELGEWVETPGDELIDLLRQRFPHGRWVAEDLGVLTPQVDALRLALGAPCTRVLQFGFGDDFPASEHLPERVPEEAVLYSGTHDNDTLRGWLEHGASVDERRRLETYLEVGVGAAEAAAELLRRCLASAAELLVVPLADLLGLGSEARINRPGRALGQWAWRAPAVALRPDCLAEWGERCAASGRLGSR